jgi:hypothetical protein
MEDGNLLKSQKSADLFEESGITISTTQMKETPRKQKETASSSIQQVDLSMNE